MKKAIIATLLAAGLMAPAMAQDRFHDRDHARYANSHRGDGRFCDGRRADRIERQVQREARQGDISWRTARDIRAMVHRTEQLERRYCSFGMNDWRAQKIDRQYDNAERLLRREVRRG